MKHSDTRRLVLLVLAVFAVFLSIEGRAFAQAASYSVGPQDVLNITVWDQPTLSGKFSVETDGTFTFPLVGRVKVGSLSLRDVESELRRLLSQGYLKDPQVSVSVDQYRSQRVFVVGEVKTAGTYPLSGEMSLIEVLARAGSTTEQAKDEVLIVRASPESSSDGPLLPAEAGSSDVLRVNLRDLQAGVVSQKINLHDGDTVFVPRAENVYVFGQVKDPGAYPLRGDMTVLQALSLAGGVTDRGSSQRVRIARIINGKKQELKTKLEDLVQAGDTIIVPERFF